MAIAIEEADDPLRLLKRLDQSIQQDAVETTMTPKDAVLVMLVNKFTPASCLQRQRKASGYARINQGIALDIPCVFPRGALRRKGYQGRRPCG
jgi:hypothetical protein